MNKTELEEILSHIDVNAQPPESEPERQYYFLKKCRGLVEKKEEELGRKLTACVTTFGCQMNARD